MLVALEWAVRKREGAWTTLHELSAISAEVTHGLLLATLKVNGVKNVGKNLHFPRPWEMQVEAKQMLTMGQFARQVMGAKDA